MSTRAGRYISQPTGYKAFIPKPLPPNPGLNWSDQLRTTLSYADRMLARLDGASGQLPNLDLFIYMYAKKEAVLSSQIEGTQASLADIVLAEQQMTTSASLDVRETLNYLAAMDYGLNRIHDLPLSLRLIREIHEKLMKGVRGSEQTPGDFRTTQNWIGSQGATLSSAVFVPPPPAEMKTALGDLENFLHDRAPIPPLIKIGLAHAQFETIHPFLDGNGRIGRLLVIFLLCHWGILHRPVLYPSHTLKKERDTYYNRLQSVRDNGDWESWLEFFLNSIAASAKDALERSQLIVKMREEHIKLLVGKEKGKAGRSLKTLDHLFGFPYVTVADVAKTAELSTASAGQLVSRLESYNLLRETTGRLRDRQFRYEPYWELLERDLDA